MGDKLSGLSVWVRTYGCQMNVYDGDVVESLFQRENCVPAEDAESADIVVLMTCSVREHAEDKVYSHIGAIGKTKTQRGGKPLLGIMGCSAQRVGQDYIKRFPQVDFVLGTHNIEEVIPTVERLLDGEKSIVEIGMADDYLLGKRADIESGSFSAYVPVARGCSRRCAYCIVPYVRGRMISRPVDEITDQIKALADQGVIEITLLGQNVDAYGRDSKYEPGLAGLLEQAAQISGLKRISFITSHPADFRTDILDVMQDHDMIAPYFHLPPQSGSNTVLKAMRRGYTREYYLELVDSIKSALPRAELAGDFIVGFPGETEKDFEESLDLMKQAAFQQAYVFKYSPREGTYAAAEMEDDVPTIEKKRRNNLMLKTQEEIQLAKNRSFVGEKVDIIVEGPSKSKPDRYIGRTWSNYRVVFDPQNDKPGSVAAITITDVTPLTLFGEKTA